MCINIRGFCVILSFVVFVCFSLLYLFLYIPVFVLF